TSALFNQINAEDMGKTRPVTELHGFPAHGGALFGRESELLDLETLLREPDTRVITLLGPGGIGKTRLSNALAEHLASSGTFVDGIYLVALAQATSRDELWQALARAIGVGTAEK